MAFILATDFDFIAYMSKMAFFGSFFHANGVFGIWFVFCQSDIKKQMGTKHTRYRMHVAIDLMHVAMDLMRPVTRSFQTKYVPRPTLKNVNSFFIFSCF